MRDSAWFQLNDVFEYALQKDWFECCIPKLWVLLLEYICLAFCLRAVMVRSLLWVIASSTKQEEWDIPSRFTNSGYFSRGRNFMIHRSLFVRAVLDCGRYSNRTETHLYGLREMSRLVTFWSISSRVALWSEIGGEITERSAEKSLTVHVWEWAG